ncbi:hypothetical protein LCGC14_2141030, partial [marine sediment metagenome]
LSEALMSPWGKAPSISWEWVVLVVFVEEKALGWGVSLSMVPWTGSRWGVAPTVWYLQAHGYVAQWQSSSET